MYNTKSESLHDNDVSMYSRFINCNKCTTLLGGVGNREAIHLWEQGVYGKFLYFSILFKPKIALKKLSLKK